jgi:dTDP-4-dehydrorhamnose reductase
VTGRQLDLADPGCAARCRARHLAPDAIVNAAAYTAVDKAEAEAGTGAGHQRHRAQAFSPRRQSGSAPG